MIFLDAIKQEGIIIYMTRGEDHDKFQKWKTGEKMRINPSKLQSRYIIEALLS